MLEPHISGEQDKLAERRDVSFVFLPLDKEMVVFSEQSQKLFAVNQTAQSILRHLQQGLAPHEVAKSLVQQGLATPDVADHWVGQTVGAVQSLRSAALQTGDDYPEAATMPPLPPFPVKVERRYRLLGSTLLVRYGLTDQTRMVESVIGHLRIEDASPPAITIDIPGVNRNGQIRSGIYRDGKPLAIAEKLSAVAPIIKAELWRCGVRGYDYLFYIHAGVVGTGKTCILFPAAPGSGKSSLTAALTRRGFTYFSDEVALIEAGSFKVPPAPLAFCVKNTGWDVIAEFYPGLLSVPTHWRRDGKTVRYLPPPGRVAAASAPVSHIVFPKYDADAPTELRPLSRSEALRRMMDECLALRRRLSVQDAQDICRWVQGIDCYTLRFSSLDEAADLVSGLAARRAGAP